MAARVGQVSSNNVLQQAHDIIYLISDNATLRIGPIM